MNETRLLRVLLCLAAFLQPQAFAQDNKPVFQLDCISFAGRFLGGAPVKKKVHPGLAVDGTIWSTQLDGKQVAIDKVVPGEAAEKAGIEPGDVVVSVNGYPTDGASLRDIFCAYHLYDTKAFTETLVVRKKDGSKKTMKLQLLTLDNCNPDEKQAWLNLYKSLGY